jgi:hypothetical protein
MTIEPGIGKLSNAERAGRRPEPEIASRLSLILGTVRIVRRERGILEVARRVAIPRLSYILKKRLVAGAIIESICLVPALRRAIPIPGTATVGIVDEPPPIKAFLP